MWLVVRVGRIEGVQRVMVMSLTLIVGPRTRRYRRVLAEGMKKVTKRNSNYEEKR